MPFYYVNPAWVAVVLCGTGIAVNAVKALLRGKIIAAALITTSMIACLALEILGFFFELNAAGGHNHSYVFAAGEVAWLMTLGELIEDATVRKTRSGIESLVGLIPKEANVVTENGIEKRPLSAIAVGDTVVVKAGEMIAVDGEIISGSTSVNQASVTGEYLPVDKTVGDQVFGGTFNTTGSVQVKVTKDPKDMTIAKMAELVEEASGSRAPIAGVADRWASYIVPSAIALSVIVGLIAGFWLKNVWSVALVRAVTILVVFCPCSLVLATPTAMSAGLGYGAKRGILIKSGASLETLANVKSICFDKTNTLTTGEIILNKVVCAGDERDFLDKVAAIEQYSDHPLAKAVMRYIDFAPKAPSGTDTVAGMGIKGVVDGVSVEAVGSARFLKNGGNIGEFAEAERDAEDKGFTVTVVLFDGKVSGLLIFSDTIKPEAKATIEELNRAGIMTVMLTGDNQKSAEFVAAACGVSEVRAGLMPADKLEVINELKKRGKVCMVGDGINDAPSLAGADCGIAMDVLGSDVAVEAADMAVLDGGIGKVAECVSLSRRVLTTVKVNIIFAMAVNVAAVICSLFGILSPVTGALVHNGNSILVVLNSARLLRNRKKKESVAVKAA